MAWDSSRPVPWQRLIRDWLIYVAIMTVVLAIVYRDRLDAGLFGGLLVSGPIFVLVGALLAKLGYQRKTLKQLRRDADTKAAERAIAGGVARPTASAVRSKPAPTRRTMGGGSRPAQRKKR
jgi:hypothetical protein